MATIVAFSVSSREMGEDALDQLDGVVADAAMVYKTSAGRIKVQQTSDLTLGKGIVRGGLIGAAASIFAGPLVGVAAAGGALGAGWAALRDKGISDNLMKLAGQQLQDGGAAVFVLTEDVTAEKIAAAVREAGLAGVEVGSFPQEAEGVVRETLKLSWAS
ncbi:MAG: DUF1269 domain-containing protein [Dermatophilaceae bacterium]